MNFYVMTTTMNGETIYYPIGASCDADATLYAQSFPGAYELETEDGRKIWPTQDVIQ